MRKSRLSQPVQNKLIELFVAGATARTASELAGVNKNTAAYYFHRSRLLIFHRCEHLEMFDGEVEADESYFGGCRKGKRGRGAAGKVVVFGLLKRNGKVYTVTVANTQSATLLPIIREKLRPDSVVYTVCHSAYNVLDVSEFMPLPPSAKTSGTEQTKTKPPKYSATSCSVQLWPMSTEPIPCPAAAPPSPPRKLPNTWPHNTMTA